MKINFNLVKSNGVLGSGQEENFVLEIPLEIPVLAEAPSNQDYRGVSCYLEAFGKSYETTFLENQGAGFCCQVNTFSVVNTTGFEPLDIIANKASREYLFVTEVFEDTGKFSAVSLGTLDNMAAVGYKKHHGDLIKCYCSYAESFKHQMAKLVQAGLFDVELSVGYLQDGGNGLWHEPLIAVMLNGFALKKEERHV
jgi:hypothetical protein